jgi:hypothetical protein
MGKHILAALLGGLLLVGVSAAFAEEPQLSDEEVLQAWGQAQTEVQQIADAATAKLKPGPQLLTDEDLDKINAAGLRGFGLETISYNGFSDFPIYPTNVLAVLNAISGIFFIPNVGQ